MISEFKTEVEEAPVVFDLSKIELGLTDDARQIMEEFDDTVFSVDEHIDDYESWIEEMLVKTTYGYEHEEFRNHPVYFKFYKDSKEVNSLPLKMFLFNAIMWYPQLQLDPDFLRNDLIVPITLASKVVPKFIKGYFDEFYVLPYRDKVSNYFMNEILSDTIHMLATLCHMFYNFLGLSMSIEVFMDLANRIPEFDELMHYRLDETKQPAEIEKEAEKASNRQWDLILNDPKFNLIKPLEATGTLKKKQLSEFDTVIPLKPDIEGNTIPHPINRNWIAGELNEITVSFINDISGRKAAIINNEFMGSAGHMLILTAILCNEAKLSIRIDDCHSPNSTPMIIRSKTHLQRLMDRYYRFGGEKEYRVLKETDEHLIGETVWLRSPATCCSSDGRICKTCYGKLASVNNDLYSIGAFAAFRVMMELMQSLLSAKHSQGTDSDTIEFIEEFFEYFRISATDIIISLENDDIEYYTLVFKQEDILTTDDDSVITIDKGKKKRKSSSGGDEESNSYSGSGDDDDNSAFSFKLDYYVTKFYVVKNFYNKKEMEITEFEELNGKKLFVHADFVSRMRFSNTEPFGDCLSVNLEDINYDEFVFMVDVQNNELSKPLKQLQSLIDNKKHEGCTNYEEMIQRMLDLIIESQNTSMSVHGELIIRQLLRDVDNVLKRPDFSRMLLPKDYQIMTINTALRKHPSITTSLSTPYLRYQLSSQMETFDKTSPSDLDSVFRETLEHLNYPVIKEY